MIVRRNVKPYLFLLVVAQLLLNFVSARADEKVMLISQADTLTLAEGESATLVYADNGEGGAYSTRRYEVTLSVTKGEKTFYLESSHTGSDVISPVTVVGPAAIKVRSERACHIATFSVTRVGTASNPSAIPQEAGSNFQVILESSSDLVNWTPANPGEYSGTEAKRFFRTRIVKK